MQSNNSNRTNSVSNYIEADAVIVGAGPVGLFQVFELGLLEIKAHVIDALDYPGGQCIELYPDKPIYDIPAVPCCTGKELTDNLLKQIEPFAPQFHLGQEVQTIAKQDDGRFLITTAKGLRFLSKTVFIAAGVGAFQPQRLRVAGIEQFENSQLFYQVKDLNNFANKDLVIVGGGDSALDWALEFVRSSPHRASSVTLLHRRDGFQAAPANVRKMRQLCAELEMQFIVGQITAFESRDDKLTAVKVLGPDTVTRRLPLDMLLVFFGLSPKLGPIANWGLQIERKQLVVDTEKFSTNIPGIFAVGDINSYPGKKKLILSGFHEAALAAYAAMDILKPNQQVTLQYTTTSPKVHRILGVESPVFDN